MTEADQTAIALALGEIRREILLRVEALERAQKRNPRAEAEGMFTLDLPRDWRVSDR